jgi:hypothetical protein
MSTIKIWYQLVKEDGIHMGSADYVELLPSSDIVKFRKQVKTENADDLLKNISPARLSVYVSKEAFESKQALEVDASVDGIGHTKQNALLVVVPSQTQGIGMRG